ncbi:hypothetical protein BA6E_10881 [Bacteroidales bacterium 6E]|nr:hypothetical protein BA6E_10881 [Bacteroidales bacterium 6E]
MTRLSIRKSIIIVILLVTGWAMAACKTCNCPAYSSAKAVPELALPS